MPNVCRFAPLAYLRITVFWVGKQQNARYDVHVGEMLSVIANFRRFDLGGWETGAC